MSSGWIKKWKKYVGYDTRIPQGERPEERPEPLQTQSLIGNAIYDFVFALHVGSIDTVPSWPAKH